MGNKSSNLKGLNQIFKDAYADKIKNLIPTGTILRGRYDRNYEKASVQCLEKWTKKGDKVAKKYLAMRTTPLGKAVNGSD